MAVLIVSLLTVLTLTYGQWTTDERFYNYLTECLPCHEDCFKCSGPYYNDCTECLFANPDKYNHCRDYYNEWVVTLPRQGKGGACTGSWPYDYIGDLDFEDVDHIIKEEDLFDDFIEYMYKAGGFNVPEDEDTTASASVSGSCDWQCMTAVGVVAGVIAVVVLVVFLVKRWRRNMAMQKKDQQHSSNVEAVNITTQEAAMAGNDPCGPMSSAVPPYDQNQANPQMMQQPIGYNQQPVAPGQYVMPQQPVAIYQNVPPAGYEMQPQMQYPQPPVYNVQSNQPHIQGQPAVIGAQPLSHPSLPPAPVEGSGICSAGPCNENGFT